MTPPLEPPPWRCFATSKTRRRKTSVHNDSFGHVGAPQVELRLPRESRKPQYWILLLKENSKARKSKEPFAGIFAAHPFRIFPMPYSVRHRIVTWIQFA